MDLLVEVKDTDDHKEDHRSEDAGIYSCDGRDIEAGGGDVVTANSSCQPLAQSFLGLSKELFSGRWGLIGRGIYTTFHCFSRSLIVDFVSPDA